MNIPEIRINYSWLLRSDVSEKIAKLNKWKLASDEQLKNQSVRSVETLGRTGRSSRSSGRFETLGLPKHGDKKSLAKNGKKVYKSSVRKRGNR